MGQEPLRDVIVPRLQMLPAQQIFCKVISCKLTSVVRTKALIDSIVLTFSVALQFPGASDTPLHPAIFQRHILIWAGHIRWDTHSDHPRGIGRTNNFSGRNRSMGGLSKFYR